MLQIVYWMYTIVFWCSCFGLGGFVGRTSSGDFVTDMFFLGSGWLALSAIYWFLVGSINHGED